MLHYVTEPNYSDVCPVFLMLHFPPEKKIKKIYFCLLNIILSSCLINVLEKKMMWMVKKVSSAEGGQNVPSTPYNRHVLTLH